MIFQGGNPIELFQLFGIDGLRNSLNFNGRNISNNNSSTNVGNSGHGSGNNINNNNLGNGHWRDRMATPMTMMVPPQMGPGGPRPPHSSMKKGYWGNKSNR